MFSISKTVDTGVEQWVHRGRIAVAVYAGVIVLTGFVYIVAMLSGGLLGAAFIGLVAMVGGCGLAGLAWGGFWLAQLALKVEENLGVLRRRVDAVESAVELHSAQSSLSATLVDDISALVAGKLEDVPYPRIVKDDEESDDGAAVGALADAMDAALADALAGAVAHSDVDEVAICLDRQVGAAEPGEPQVISNEQVHALRAAFAARLRDGDFAAALKSGEEIVARFPRSRMAGDFERIRPHLQRRAGSSPSRAGAMS